MSIQKRTSRTGETRWVARYRDPNGKERSKTFDTQRQAKKWIAEKQTTIDRGEWIDPQDSKITVGSLFEQWAESATRENTRMVRGYTLKNLKGIKDIEVGKLRRQDIQNWVNSLADGTGSVSGAPLAPVTVRTCLKHLRTVLSQAVFDKAIPSSPAQRIHLEPVPKAVDVDKIPTPTEVASMINAAKDLQRKNMDALVMLLASTGLRASEACGLTCGDIDFMNRKVKVRRQMSTSGEVVPLKTLSARRDVHLPEDLALALAPLCSGDSEAPLFARKDGKAFTRIDVASVFASLRRKLGGNTTAHALRHFYASALISAGVDVRSVQAALGHASASVTLDTYSHLWPDSDSRTARAGENLLRDICGIAAEIKEDDTSTLQVRSI